MVRESGIGDDEPLYGFWGIFHLLRTTVNKSVRPLAMRLADSDLPLGQDHAS